MESENNNNYRKVYISFQLSEEANERLSESAKRSARKKMQEARLRLEDHLKLYRSISEPNQRNLFHTEESDVHSSNI